MNRCRWTYISTEGSRNQVGLLHSPSLGHFVIYCDRKIVLADRKVFESKSYSFFINEELCQIHVIKNEADFQYQFTIDTKTQTPLNLFRKKLNQKHLLYSLLTFSFLFIMVAAVMITGFVREKNRLQTQIDENGVLTTAFIQVLQADSDYHIFYTYRNPNRYYREKLGVFDTPSPILDNGFPLEDGDTFFLTYAAEDPENHILHLEYPPFQLFNKYRTLAKERFMRTHPNQTEGYCNCVLQVAYDIKGWEGYAIFYNENTPSEEQPMYNKSAYENLINLNKFKEEAMYCLRYE